MKLKHTLIAALLTVTSVALPFYANAHNDTDKIKVMSRNLYLGADIFPVVEIATGPLSDPADPAYDPSAFPLAVSGVLQTVLTTNFPERAEALADEIERRKPHAIGLQEVSIWRTQVPGDFLANGAVDASDVVVDFLDVLLAALDARGLNYTAAVTSTNADLELPMIVGVDGNGAPIFGDLRLTDQDVILVKDNHNVSYSNPLTGHFSNQVQIPVGAVTLEFTRGYTMADITVKGATYRFVNSHLEVGGSEPFKSFQAWQMQELMGITAATANGLPTIMLGDFNSSPDDQPFVSPYTGALTTPPYLQAVGAGLIDLWLQKKRPKDGFTCCFDPLVSDPDAQLTQRIDHIFLNPNGREVKKLKTKRVGNSNADMTDTSGLFPSDHAGLFGKIKLKD